MIDSSDLKLNQPTKGHVTAQGFLHFCIYFPLKRVSELAAILQKLLLPISTYILCN